MKFPYLTSFSVNGRLKTTLLQLITLPKPVVFLKSAALLTQGQRHGNLQDQLDLGNKIKSREQYYKYN